MSAGASMRGRLSVKVRPAVARDFPARVGPLRFHDSTSLFQNSGWRDSWTIPPFCARLILID